MTTFQFTIPGDARPEAKRQRFFARGEKVHVGSRTDLPDRADWKARVAAFAKQAGAQVMHGPLMLEVVFVRVKPGSWPRKPTTKRPWPDYPTTKPDLNNLIKPLEDALTGIVWVDDAQIVRSREEKVFGEEPEVRVIVTQLAGE